MTPRYNLRLTTGALAPDGGSIFLEAVAGGSKPICIYLDWSLAAQEAKATSLEIDRQSIAKRSPEEAAWIAAIAAADTGGDAALALFRASLLEKLRSPAYAQGKPGGAAADSTA